MVHKFGKIAGSMSRYFAMFGRGAYFMLRAPSDVDRKRFGSSWLCVMPSLGPMMRGIFGCHGGSKVGGDHVVSL